MIVLPLSCSVTISFNFFLHFISFTIVDLEKCKVFLIKCYEFRKRATRSEEEPTERQNTNIIQYISLHYDMIRISRGNQQPSNKNGAMIILKRKLIGIN